MRITAKTVLLAPLLAALIAMAGAPSSSAATPTPGWGLRGRAVPTVLAPGKEGVVELLIFNLGAMSSTPGAVVTETLPPGLTPTNTDIAGTDISPYGTCAVAGQTVTCTLTKATELDDPWQAVSVAVKVNPNMQEGTVVAHASISGGGALESTSTTIPLKVGTKAAGTGIESLGAWISNANGEPDTQAGSHPYSLLTAVMFNSVSANNEQPNANASLRSAPAGGQPRSVNFNLPPGIVGNPQAVPECPRIDLVSNELKSNCPADTQIGWNHASLGTLGAFGNAPVYNMVPPAGIPAQFAFIQTGAVVYLDAGVRTGGDNGITEHVPDIPERDIVFNWTEIWGVPAEASHDSAREGWVHGEPPGNGEGCVEAGPANNCPSEAPHTPFLTLGTSCGGAPEFSMEERGTWEEENLAVPSIKKVPMHDDNENSVGFTGCERLQPFKPEVTIAPDTSYADTPAGLSVDVRMPQGLNPEGLQTPGLKGTTVILPEGVVINPGQATGLEACQPSQEALGEEPDGEINEGPVSCPAASKVGTDEVSSPLLRDKLQGNVYILQQNPPNLQLLIAASGDGVNLKLVGNVHLDENTGQLVTTFENTPDLPFTEFKLAFSSGAQAALATPTRCGTYESNAEFTPWSSPFIAEVFDSSRFQIDGDIGGSVCPSGPLPFDPSLTAGATTDQAGGFTDFSLLLQRGDGQQRIAGLQFKAPEGLTGFLSKVPLCTNAQAESDTCPEASKIGHTVVESGPGPYPLVVPEAGQPPAPIYLTESYDGAPFGLSIVVPLHVGPFTLETQRVRAKIEVDPYTSALTVTTNGLPQEVAGIPTDLREVDAVIERPEFMVNPTNCSPQEFSGTAYGAAPPGVSEVGESSSISSHFQVGSCRSLQFTPTFSVSTSGKTSRADGASLTAKVTYPDVPQGSEADIGYVKVELPKALPSRLTTLQKACANVQFETNPAGCPAASNIGSAVVHTPLLSVPLEGPAIFVSHGGEAFPSLELVLQGDGVKVILVGTTFISKAGITSTTFKMVPDDPFSTFELTLPEGKYSALAANGNLCSQKLAMPTVFKAQNSAEIHESTPVEVTGCSSALSISSHSIKKTTATLKVYVPAAGTVKVSGNGLPTKSSKAKGRETLTFKLTQKQGGKLSTKVSVLFTPGTGKDRKKQSKSVSLRFEK